MEARTRSNGILGKSEVKDSEPVMRLCCQDCTVDSISTHLCIFICLFQLLSKDTTSLLVRKRRGGKREWMNPTLNQWGDKADADMWVAHLQLAWPQAPPDQPPNPLHGDHSLCHIGQTYAVHVWLKIKYGKVSFTCVAWACGYADLNV